MIFVGDISLPQTNSIKLINFPKELLAQKWIGNLEGALVHDSTSLREQLIVYNDISAFHQLLSQFNFHGFLLANNHILDCGSIDETKRILDVANLSYAGLSAERSDDVEFIEISENGHAYLILNYGWEVIQCQVAKGTSEGVEPLEKDHVIKSFKKISSKFPNHKILVAFHWNYELEAYPHPRERDLSRCLIDLGAAAIIGGHPHRIGGFEIYKDKPIIYSLGNWLFLQNYYNKGRLRFPDFCNKELALEYNPETEKMQFHLFQYDRTEATLTYLNTEDITSQTMADLTPFRDMKNDSYEVWYKDNRYHKKKGLPIYYWNDSSLIISLKNKVVKFRDMLIKIIIALRLK